MKKKSSQIQYGRSYRYGSSERAIKDLTRVEKKQREAKRGKEVEAQIQTRSACLVSQEHEDVRGRRTPRRRHVHR